MRLFRPEVFQGDISSARYFEGWYFKHVSKDLDHVYAFIPGISLNTHHPHSFIQVLDGISGESSYIEYPVDAFHYDTEKFFVRVGHSEFSSSGIELDVNTEKGKIRGSVSYSGQIPWPSTILSPGIMGWYSFVPFMECKHAVVSVNHNLAGTIEINGRSTDFTHGKGYIEKDWGRSFPEAWIWSQCNNFTRPDASFMISVAKIPWLGSFFTGFLSYLYTDGKFYRFMTYNGSKITRAVHDRNHVEIGLTGRDQSIDIIIEHAGSGRLKAPVSGIMDRIIKESIDSSVKIVLRENGKIIFEDKGERAGVEIIEKIFDYI